METKYNYKFENEIDAIKNAICHYVIFNLSHTLDDDEYCKMINFIDPDYLKKISDDDFLKDKRLCKYIDYNRINRTQLIRLMIRDESIIEYIDLKKTEFKILELEFFLKIHPDKLKCFEFNVDNLTGREAIILLATDLNYLYEIGFEKIKFSRLELQELINNFYDVEEVINKIDFELLDNFILKTIIIKTKDKYINRIDLNKLNNIDWVDILKIYPDLFCYCRPDIFTSSNGLYQLVNLVKSVDGFDHLIIENKDNLTALDWEMLLLHDEKFIDYCNFSLFKTINWNSILKEKPHLKDFRVI